MLMHEKIERSRANAQRALDAYRYQSGGVDTDDLAAIGDLVADLMHLADELGRKATPGDGYDFTDPSRETAGAYCHRIAADHHLYESDPANANEHV